MKYSETKLVGNDLTVVTVEFGDRCENGYETFFLGVATYIRGGSRREAKKKYGKYTYYLDGLGRVDKGLIETHFPKLLPFYDLDCDRFGMPSYPILNTLTFLNDEKTFEYGCKSIDVTPEVGNQIKKYTDFHFGEFLKKHIDEVTKPKIDKAIQLLEELTGVKYVEKLQISAKLFNDLHYTLVSDKKGLNVFKKSPKTNYNEIFDI